jgi:fructose-specific phosphotransferase system IIC component
VKALEQIKVPDVIKSLSQCFFLPLLGTFFVCMAMTYVLGGPVAC